MDLDIQQIRDQAQKELREEAFKAAVTTEKRRLLERKSFWQRVFPWRIRVIHI